MIIVDWIFILLIIIGMVISWSTTLTMMVAVFLAAILARYLASKGRFFLSTPVNSFILVTPIKNQADVTKGGGDVTDILHAVPGKKILRNLDMMRWSFVDGEEERDALNFLLLRYLGIQYIGIFRYARINEVKDLRLRRDAATSDYEIRDRSKSETFVVFFSENPAVALKGVETKGALKIDLSFNLITEREFPLFSVVRVADIHAVLTAMVREVVISTTTAHTAEETINDGAIRKKICNGLENPSFIEAVLKATGLRITEVNLIDVDYDEATRVSLEQKQRAKIAAEARVEEAKGQRDAELLLLEPRIQEVERVLRPMADLPQGAHVIAALAYRDNKTVTTYAPGGNSGVLIGVDPKKKE